MSIDERVGSSDLLNTTIEEEEKKSQLYNFQESAIQQMEELDHVLLFDEMGLGKSIQALEHVQRKNLKPCLINCPKTLIWNWFQEIQKWYPNETPIVFQNTDQFLDAFLDNKNRFFIMWHDLLSRFNRDDVLAVLPKLNWKSYIVDEAHLFRNWKTKRGEAFLLFNNPKIKKIILTGTPIVNSALDLYPLMQLTDVNISPLEIQDRYTFTRSTPYGRVSQGVRNSAELRERIGNKWIRRTKTQVLKDLPPKTESTLPLQMDEDQQEAYYRLVDMMMIELDSGLTITADGVLAMITRMRQLCLDPRILGKTSSSAKTNALLELIESHDGKVVVYTNFKQYVDILQKDLEARKIKNTRVTGNEKPTERMANVRRFDEDPSTKVFLATQAGGLGLNLTKANVIVICDRWWNKARTSQAIDRIHRIGQKDPISAITLHTMNSIDDHIEAIVEKKDAVAQEIVQAIRNRGF